MYQECNTTVQFWLYIFKFNQQFNFGYKYLNLISCSSNNGQDIHKDVYNIKIKIQCSENIFFRTD